MEEPNRFQKLVAEAKKYIKEISPNDAALELGCGAATLIDVRSDEDWKGDMRAGRSISIVAKSKWRSRNRCPISISESSVIAAAAVAPHSSRRACRNGLSQRALDDRWFSRMENGGITDGGRLALSSRAERCGVEGSRGVIRRFRSGIPRLRSG